MRIRWLTHTSSDTIKVTATSNASMRTEVAVITLLRSIERPSSRTMSCGVTGSTNAL